MTLQADKINFLIGQSMARRVTSKSWLGKNSRELAKHDQNSSSIGHMVSLFC